MSGRSPRSRLSTTKRNLPSFIAQQNPHKQKKRHKVGGHRRKKDLTNCQFLQMPNKRPIIFYWRKRW